MTPMQQMFLGVGASKKTYLDDVFSTQVYTGNSSARSINNGIDLSGEGGLVWSKRRNGNYYGPIIDTVRGKLKILNPANSGAQGDYANTSGNEGITSFNSNGYSLGADGSSQVLNHTNNTYASWTFRKAKGFFDIVEYTASSGVENIAHNLKSIPGMIIVKNLDASVDWAVYHRSAGASGILELNATQGVSNSANYWNNTEPTSTHFTVNDSNKVGSAGVKYIAYLFAGGESTQSEAVSVDFDGTGDYLNTTSSSSDFTMGTGDFTVECWVKADDVTSQGIFEISTTSGGLATSTPNQLSVWVASNDTIKFSAAGAEQQPPIKAQNGQWQHVAVVRNSGTTSLYVNGILSKSVADTFNHTGTYIAVGGYYNTDYVWDGQISNFRVVKGTAVYTSSFRPPTEPLTNISGTVLLCCNNSSVTGSTVTPATLNSQGNPTASTDSPFDDPAGFKFGESGLENVIKCGTCPPGSSDAKIELGFQPQFLLMKTLTSSSNWEIWDSMRGGLKADSGGQGFLAANLSNAESSADGITVDATGFSKVSQAGEQWIYMAIRSAVGAVTRPPELGTGVFAMDTGNGSSTIPNFDSTFPVDYAFARITTSTGNWGQYSRLTGDKYLRLNTTDAQGTYSGGKFDSNVGFGGNNVWNSTYQAWMWKRHAGFDVVTYTGSYAAADHPHSLGKIPEMYWIKKRNAAAPWRVYHKGVNGGSNPEEWYMELNSTAAQSQADSPWFAPTSTHLRLKSNGNVQWANTFIAMLFASVDGISKVGSFSGSNSDLSVNVGFQPRLLIIKGYTGSNATYGWFTFDSLRGFSSGNDSKLHLNDTAAPNNSYNTGTFTSTGFTLTGGTIQNASGTSYIYYAHA